MTSFAYQRPYTIDHTKIGAADLTNFACLVDITATELKHTTYGGKVTSMIGADIAPFSSTALTTLYDFDLVSYNPIAGRWVAWVRTPTASHTVDPVIRIGYKNSSVTSLLQNRNGTWASNYLQAVSFKTPAFDPVRIGTTPLILASAKAYHASQLYDFNTPFVNPSDATQLVCVYSVMAAPVATGEQKIARMTAPVADPTNWTEGAAPVLAGTAATWDAPDGAGDKGIRAGSTKLVGSRAHTFYNTGATDSVNAIGHAYSDDAAATYTKNAGNPVLSPSGAMTHVSQPRYLLEPDGTHALYFGYRTVAAALPGIRRATASAIDGAYTYDGLGDVISKGASGTAHAGFLEYGQLIQEGLYTYMVLECGFEAPPKFGHWGASIFRILTASLPGHGAWTPSPMNPILSPSYISGRADEKSVATPCFYKPASEYLMLFCATAAYPDYSAATWDLWAGRMGQQTLADFFGALDLTDSTANGNDFVNTGSVTVSNQGGGLPRARLNGVNNKLTRTGLSLGVTGCDDFLFTPRNDPLLTSGFIYSINKGTPDQVFHIAISTGGGTIVDSAAGWYNAGDDDRAIVGGDTGIRLGVSSHYVVTWTDAVNTLIYVDAVLKKTGGALNAQWTTTTSPEGIGYDDRSPLYTAYDMQALRVRNVAPTADEVAAERTMFTNTAWATLGAEEVGPPAPVYANGSQTFGQTTLITPTNLGGAVQAGGATSTGTALPSGVTLDADTGAVTIGPTATVGVTTGVKVSFQNATATVESAAFSITVNAAGASTGGTSAIRGSAVLPSAIRSSAVRSSAIR